MDEGSVSLGLTRIVSDESDATKQLVDPRAVKKASPYDLVELAREVQKADSFVKATASSKLQMIAEQIKFLQEQARRVLEEAHEANFLHHAKCNFKKIPGKIYYLYKRPSGELYFSIVSPQEWGGACPHSFIDAYRLEHDMSWTKEEHIEVKDGELDVIEKILHTNSMPRLEFLADAAHDKPGEHHHDHMVDNTDHPVVEEHFD